MAKNLMEQFMSDSTSTVPVSNNQLAEISKLAEMQLEMEDQIAMQEAVLDNMKEKYRKLTEEAIPTAMDSVGLTSFTLSDGSKITVKDEVYASIRKDYQMGAFSWLDNNGLGDIIKNDISIKLGRGENELAEQVKTTLKNEGVPFNESMSVHSKTLAATVKEQAAKGVVFPEELFSVFFFKKTSIKKPKGA